MPVSSPDAPIFLLGLPRSGSTLWTNVIRQHPDVIVFTEMHFLTPWRRDFRHLWKKANRLRSRQDVVQLVDAFFKDPPGPGISRGFHFWREIRELEPLGLREALIERIEGSDRSIGSIFRILIEEAAKCRGNRRVLVKFPVYPIYMNRLISWWPEARMLHISRDPRALAASKTNDPGGVAKLKERYPRLRGLLPVAGKTFAVIQYMWTSHIPERFSSSSNYRLFLYEDLLFRPEETIRELCAFCGLDFTESMLSPTAGQASSVTGIKASGFDPSRIHGWQRVLSPWEINMITRLTRRSMARFGYQPDVYQPAAGT